MKLTELRVGFARTINLGNFESLRVEASVTTDLTEADNLDLNRVHDVMQTELRTLLEETYRRQIRKKEEASGT